MSITTLTLATTLLPSPTLAQDAASFRQTWLGEFETSARKLVALAEAMPAESFSWQPMEGVATVASAYMHIATYNYLLPLNIGIQAPAGVDYRSFEEAVTGKDQVLEVLKTSLDHVRQAVGGMSDADLSAPANLFGRETAAWGVLFRLVAHMNEHLGQQIAYARMNRVAPPWSR
ncbi:MAG: DinB family protein [Gemmatimonadota bacterium]|nr:DinB family protein [Gemmatimonadota bacterium]MDE2986024.1 DinB family protein [Gemmatimonadota bacterium]